MTDKRCIVLYYYNFSLFYVIMINQKNDDYKNQQSAIFRK